MTARDKRASKAYDLSPPPYDAACQVWTAGLSHLIFTSPNSPTPTPAHSGMPRRAPASSTGLGIEDELSFGSDEDLLADVGEISVGATIPPPLPHMQSGPMVNVSEVKLQKSGRNRMLGGLKSLGGGKKEKESRKRTTTVESLRSSDAAPSRSSLNLSSSSRDKKEKKDSRSLAGSALIIEPQLESVLDLSANGSYYNVSSPNASGSTPSLGSTGVGASAMKKKPGLMGAFKGLRGKKEEPVRVYAGSNGANHNRIHPVQSRDSIGSRTSGFCKSHVIQPGSSQSDFLHLPARQQSFDYSGFSNSPQTDSSHTSSAQHHTLAPISTSPFKGQSLDLAPDQTIRSVSSASRNTDGSSLARRTSLAGSATTGTSGGLPSSRGTFGGKWTPLDGRSLDRPSSIPSSSGRVTRPSLISTISTSSSSMAPPSPITPSISLITSVLLPSFPASLSSLESIQILSATVIKRTYTSPGLPDKEKSSSLRGLAGMLPSGTATANASSPKKPIWITQQLVLTSFKVGGSTPHASPDPSGFSSARTQSDDSTSRTIAHLHVFNVPGATVAGHAKTPPRSSANGTVGLGISSSQNFAQRPRGSVSEDLAEIERKVITANSTAGVWDDHEGRRKYVMRVMFGRSSENEHAEWVLEMRNAEQLHEWVRQIKSVAVLIRAEREGYGQVIGDAYKSGTLEADDLALELDMERRATNARSPLSESTASGSDFLSHSPALNYPALKIDDVDSGSARPPGMERNVSAARSESPDMLGQRSAPDEEEEFDEADRLAQQLMDFELSGGLSRQESYDDRFSLLGAFPLAPESTDRAVRPASTAYPPHNVSAFEDDIGPTDQSIPSNNHTFGGPGAVLNLSRRAGTLRNPPPPPRAPPTMPLPALPTNQLQVTVDDDAVAPAFSAPRSIITQSQLSEASAEPPSPRLNNEPRLSLPSLEPALAIPDRELALLQARQHYRAASLPMDDGSAQQAAAKMRKDRFAMSFKPIPLAPEMTQSPVLSSGGNTPRSTGSPLVPHPVMREEGEGIKTPAASQLSRLPDLGLGIDVDDGTSTPGFFTPSEEPSSISISMLETPSSFDHHPHPYKYTDELDRLRLRQAENQRPENQRYSSNDAASIISTPSVSSRASTTGSRRRRGIKPVAVDIMSEFSESADASYQEEGEEAIKEDRPRVIRFAEG